MNRKLVKNSRGFSLIELLVVIAIIGILSAVILSSLGGARQRARLGRVQSQMSSLHPFLVMCLNDDATLAVATPAKAGGTTFCGGLTTFPALPSNWDYGASTANSYRATGETKTVTCTETGCVTTP